MVSEVDKWEAFDAWNAAIAEAVYPVTREPRPVYLDLEEETLGHIGARLGIQSGDVLDRLRDVVRSTVEPGRNTGFHAHAVRFGNWRRSRVQQDPPPILPLLAVFSLAAEHMAAEGGMADSNYYGRLVALVGGRRDSVAASYRAVAELLWGGLNGWLVELGGRRGLPTATAIGHRHVGLAISQALVREADRRRLGRFFTDFGLTPRSDVPPADLEPLLEAWISKDGSPATPHLAKLWRRADLQGRIAEVAATELAAWDGIEDVPADSGIQRARLGLTLEIASFPRPRTRLDLVVRSSAAAEPRPAVLKTLGGDVPVTLVPDAYGSFRLAEAGLLGPTELLEGNVVVDQQDVGGASRQPRRLVVFRKDELAGRWEEVPQVLMGDDVTLLLTEALLPKVREMLEQVARPGWEESRLPGLPEGWTAVRRVEIFAKPVGDAGGFPELTALSALTSSQLKLAGGLALPGAVRGRWHVARPPQVRAVTDAGDAFEVRLLDLGILSDDGDEQTVLEVWQDGGSGAVVADLASCTLAPGRYAVELVEASGVRARREFELRSSDDPDMAQWATVLPITHRMDDPLATLAADARSEEWDVALVQGVPLQWQDDLRVHPRGEIPSRPWWGRQRDDERTGTLLVARPAPGSCFYTGMHRIELPPALVDKKYRPIASESTGRCSGCGMERRYSSSYYRNKRRYEQRLKRAAAAEHLRAAAGTSCIRA